MKLKNNVPDTYVKRSRDFQLLCDVFDVMNQGVKFDIDTLSSLSDTTRCRSSMLVYLQHKLGLHMDKHITDDKLRVILKCFPHLVKKKGSRDGIVQAICLFLYIMHCNGEGTADVYNVTDTADMAGNYIVEVSVEESLPDVDILVNILKYIIPFGYKVNYTFYTSPKGLETHVANSDEVNIIIVDEDTGSQVRNTSSEGIDYPGVLHGVGTTVVRVSRDSSYKLDRTFESGVTGSTSRQLRVNKIKDGVLYEDTIIK